jgi:hypothetical protein
VGESRQWVNKWRNQDHGFMEALAERREVMRAMHMNRICQLMDRAMVILEEAMEGEDEKARLYHRRIKLFKPCSKRWGRWPRRWGLGRDIQDR